MKLWLSYLAIATSALVLQGCGGSIGDKTRDRDDLIPIPVVDDGSDRARPTATIPVITTNEHELLDNNLTPILLRGINVDLSQDPVGRAEGINTLAQSGSNVVRLQITEATTEKELETAMVSILNRGMIALVTLTGPKLTCVESDVDFIKAVDELWLKKWLTILAEDRFQSNLMISIADGWGPSDIFAPDSRGYEEYMDNYKAAIRKFRKAGFKVPLVVDAPSCGQDYNAFLSNRGRELVAADEEKNIVVSMQVAGSHWDTSVKIDNANANLHNEKVPYIVSAFSGSEVGEKPINHIDLMNKAIGEHALSIDLPWGATDDAVGYSTKFSAPVDMSAGSTVTFKVFLDRLYAELVTVNSQAVPTGKLSIVSYIKDAQGNRLKLGEADAKTLRINVWSNLRYEGPRDVVDPANLMNGATAFDLKSVTELGIAIMANGKEATVKAPIKIDDVTVFPGAPLPTLAVESTFDTGAGGWSRPDWSPGKAVVEGGYFKLSLNPGDWGVFVESPAWMAPDIVPKIDFKQTVFVDMKVFIPASYTRAPDFKFIGFFGGATNPEVPAAIVGEVKYGDWNNYRATLKFSEGNDVSAPQNMAFVMGGEASAEPVLIDTITITQQQAKRVKIVTALQYESKFTKNAETFASSWNNVAKVEQADGVLNITPGWKNIDGNQDDFVVVFKENISTINEIDVSGPVTYKVKIFVPASYAGSALDFEIITADSTWGHIMEFPGRHLTIADFNPGEWTSFTFTTDNFPPDFVRTKGLQFFGFVWKGVNFDPGTVKIDDIQLYGNTEVDDSEPTLALDFSQQAQVYGLKPDFVKGSLSSSSVDIAKVWGFNVSPFGWIASTWRGGVADMAGLDISTSDKTFSLTARGEEIVNGANGITATSVLATFPPVTTPK